MPLNKDQFVFVSADDDDGRNGEEALPLQPSFFFDSPPKTKISVTEQEPFSNSAPTRSNDFWTMAGNPSTYGHICADTSFGFDCVHITLVSGLNLPRFNCSMDGTALSPYCCTSLIESCNEGRSADSFNATEMGRLDHDACSKFFANLNRKASDARVAVINSDLKEQALSKIRALWKSKVVEKEVSPLWNQTCVLDQVFVASDLQEPFDIRRPVVPRAKVKGQDLLLLLTVHHEDVFENDEFVGRVVIPSLLSGESITNSWFPLESKNGTAVYGENGKRSLVQLSIEYKRPNKDFSELEKERLRRRKLDKNIERSPISPPSRHLSTSISSSPSSKPPLPTSNNSPGLFSNSDSKAVVIPVMPEQTSPSQQSIMYAKEDAADIEYIRSLELRRRMAFEKYSEYKQHSVSPQTQRSPAPRMAFEKYSEYKQHSVSPQTQTSPAPLIGGDGDLCVSTSPQGIQKVEIAAEKRSSTTGYGMVVGMIEARRLPPPESKQDAQRQSNVFACLTLVADPDLIQHEDYIKIGHSLTCNVLNENSKSIKACSLFWDDEDNASAKADHSTSLSFAPQKRTHVVEATQNPQWNTKMHFTKTYPNIRTIEAASAKQQSLAFMHEEIALDGSPVLMLVTLHDVASDESVQTIGRVLVPFVRPGICVDQWFVLQDLRGLPLASQAMLPPAVRLTVQYTNVECVPTSIQPYKSFPCAPLRTEVVTSNTFTNMLTPRSFLSKHKATTFTPAPSCLMLRIVEVRDVQLPKDLGEFNNVDEMEVKMYLNLHDDVNVEVFAASVMRKINHVMPEEQVQQMQGRNFSLTDSQILLRPQCTTRSYDLRTCNGAWDDKLCLFTAYPSLEALYKGHKRGKARVLDQEIALRGQRVVAFMTLQMLGERLHTKLAYAAIQCDASEHNIESWHRLLSPNGIPLVGTNGRASMVRIAVEYRNRGAGEDEMGSSPFNDGNRNLQNMEGVISGQLSSEPNFTPCARNGSGTDESHKIRPGTPERPLSRRCMGIVHVCIFEGRNFSVLREPEVSCKILCELVLQGHGFHHKSATTPTVPDTRTPKFPNSEFQFEIEPANLLSAVLKVNIVLVNGKTLQRIGKVRRVKLQEVMTQGSMSCWFEINARESYNFSSTSTSSSKGSNLVSLLVDTGNISSKTLPARSPGTPRKADLNFNFSPGGGSRVGLQGDESEDISNYMQVDMLLSQDESRNDRMLRAELHNNNMQRLQIERRLHPTQGTADVAAVRMEIRYMPPEVLGPQPTPYATRSTKYSAHEQTGSLSLTSPSTKTSLKVGGVGLCLAVGKRGEHVVDYLVEGGAAKESGKVSSCDVLIDIDGFSMTKESTHAVQHFLRGDVGSPVSVTFERPSPHGPVQTMVTVLRKHLKPPNFSQYQPTLNPTTNIRPVNRSHNGYSTRSASPEQEKVFLGSLM